MFSGIKRFVGYVSVEETVTHIILEGLSGYDIMRDIHKKWQTSKINTQIFTQIGKTKMVFPKFFAIEVLYIFKELLADPQVRTSKRLLHKVVEEFYHQTWLKDIEVTDKHNRIDLSKLDEISFKLLPHQMDFLASYNRIVPSYRLNGLLLAAAPGSGKTVLSLAVGSCVKADVIIAIVPNNSLERVWEATMRDNLVQQPEYWVSKRAGEKAPVGLRYYAFHYEALDRALELAKTIDPSKKVCIILDECHNFNEIKSTRTQMFIKLCEMTKSQDVIWASGTPVKAIGAECVPMLRTIDSMFTCADTEERFRKIFGKDAKKANDILCNRIGIIAFKINKQEVVDNNVTIVPIKVSIPNGEHYTLDAIRTDMRNFIAERTKYYNERFNEIHDFYKECLEIHESWLRGDKEKDDFARYNRYIKIIRTGYNPELMKAEVMYCNKYELQSIIPTLPDQFKKEFKSARSVIKYVSLKIMGEALGGILGKRRSQCHVEMVDHMQLDVLIDKAEKKTVIFTSYVEVVDKAEQFLIDAGYKPLKVYGDTNKNLAKIISAFEKDENVNPLIATYQSLSTAVPLIMANNVIMTNAPFRDHEREQAIARVDRLGQDMSVCVNDIYLDTGMKPNISTRSKDIMEWSKNQVEQILGVKTPTDLEATLEAMMDSTVELSVSQEAFVQACLKEYKK